MSFKITAKEKQLILKRRKVLYEIRASKRIWYHGTHKKAWEKIKQSKGMTPSLSDDKSFGEAIWFTSDLDEARGYADTYGKRRGNKPVVLSITEADSKRFKRKKVSAIPRGFIKKMGLNKKDIGAYMLVIFDKIPIKYIKEVNID